MNEEFNLNQLIAVVLPKWPLVLIVTLVFAIGSFFYSSYFIEPMYTASGTLYVTGDVNAVSATIKEDTNLSDLMLSQELAKTYGQILSSNTFFKEVAEKSKTGYSYSQIQRMANITNVEGTGLLKISITHGNPQMAAHLVNCILELAPEEIARIVVSGSATTIDPAEVPVAPSSPSIPKNTMLGALIGAVLVIGIVLLRNFFDNTIKTSEEVENLFNLPVLGTIPTIELKEDNEDGYSYGYGVS